VQIDVLISKLEECQLASLDVPPNSRCLVARRTAGRERSIGSAWRAPIADPDGITVLRIPGNGRG
jgi:hypothetical protein